MLKQGERIDTQQTQEDSADARKVTQKKLSRIGNNVAKQAESTEQNYDGDHGIFTK